MKISTGLYHNIASFLLYHWHCCNLAGSWNKSKKILQSTMQTKRPWLPVLTLSSSLGLILCLHHSTSFVETITELGEFLWSLRLLGILGCFSLLGNRLSILRLSKERSVRKESASSRLVSELKLVKVFSSN